VVVPFHLVQNGPLIRYSFASPDEILQLRLGENSSRLDLVTGSGTEQFEASNLKQKIRGTCVTYEDLAFKFLYWPTARVLGEESVRTRKCWKLQLRAPSRESQYSNVLLWVDKASGALMRMEGYDWNAQLIKRFEVVSAQKIEGRWFLKQMRVEQLQPGTNHARERAYLEIKRYGMPLACLKATSQAGGMRYPNAADAGRISRRSRPACGRGTPCRAIPPLRALLHQRFAFAQ